MEVVDKVSEKRCPDGTSFVGRGEPTSPGMGERDVSFPQGVQGLSASRVRHVRLSQMSGMATLFFYFYCGPPKLTDDHCSSYFFFFNNFAVASKKSKPKH